MKDIIRRIKNIRETINEKDFLEFLNIRMVSDEDIEKMFDFKIAVHMRVFCMYKNTSERILHKFHRHPDSSLRLQVAKNPKIGIRTAYKMFNDEMNDDDILINLMENKSCPENLTLMIKNKINLKHINEILSD
jgi:hypothetical protein